MKIAKRMTILSLAWIAYACSGCNGSAGGSSTQAAPVGDVAPIVDPAPGDGNRSAPTGPVTVTYYALSRTEAPINGWPSKTYTATGYCAEIEGMTFCWSDGLKTLQWTSNNFQYGPHRYNYFGLSTSNGNPQTCHGGCTDDYLQAPALVTNQLLNVLDAQMVQDVFDHGTEQTMTCNVVDDTLDCGSVIFQAVQ